MVKQLEINGVYFTEVTGARAENLRSRYKYADYTSSIYSIYGRPSIYKVNAWEWCENLQYKLNGYDCKAWGNCSTFTYAFTCYVNGVLKLVYITKDHNYICDLDK